LNTTKKNTRNRKVQVGSKKPEMAKQILSIEKTQ
jgi:hypothetical protein